MLSCVDSPDRSCYSIQRPHFRHLIHSSKLSVMIGLIMAPLQAFLLLLVTTVITSVNAATPEEVAKGKLPGYTHG